MSVLAIGAGILGLGGIGAAMAFIPGAIGFVGNLAAGAINFLGKVNWAKVWWLLPIGAAVVFGLIERGEAMHQRKLDAGHVADIAVMAKWQGAVMVEVNRGVCGEPAKPKCAVPDAHAPDQIRSFVDNLATERAAHDRQSKALDAAKQDAAYAQGAAHVARQPTKAQHDREALRRQIGDPKRTTGLTPGEWGKM